MVGVCPPNDILKYRREASYANLSAAGFSKSVFDRWMCLSCGIENGGVVVDFFLILTFKAFESFKKLLPLIGAKPDINRGAMHGPLYSFHHQAD
jgi:hypothetical protein